MAFKRSGFAPVPRERLFTGYGYYRITPQAANLIREALQRDSRGGNLVGWNLETQPIEKTSLEVVRHYKDGTASRQSIPGICYTLLFSPFPGPKTEIEIVCLPGEVDKYIQAFQTLYGHGASDQSADEHDKARQAFYHSGSQTIDEVSPIDYIIN